jgi:hypothetical protein
MLHFHLYLNPDPFGGFHPSHGTWLNKLLRLDLAATAHHGKFNTVLLYFENLNYTPSVSPLFHFLITGIKKLVRTTI